MSQGILVFIEQRKGQIRKASYEALSEARRRCDLTGEPVTALLVGSGVAGLSDQVGAYKPDKVLIADTESLANYSTEGYANALAEAVKSTEPRFVFASCTAMSKDFMPRVAARLDAPLASDVVEFIAANGATLAVRPVYSGKARSIIEFNAPTSFVTLRANAFPRNEPVAGNKAAVDNLAVSADNIRARVSEAHAANGQTVELSEASIVVSGGRGIKGPEHWQMLQSLCDVLGAALGASRAVVDAGWIDHQHQVGQTGKTVSPQLYIACGISGAIQHLAGMSSSKIIVAINKDKEAPIFKYATYGVVGDVFEVVPKLTEEIKKMQENN